MQVVVERKLVGVVVVVNGLVGEESGLVVVVNELVGEERGLVVVEEESIPEVVGDKLVVEEVKIQEAVGNELVVVEENGLEEEEKIQEVVENELVVVVGSVLVMIVVFLLLTVVEDDVFLWEMRHKDRL